MPKAEEEKATPFKPRGELVFGENENRPKVVPTQIPIDYWIDPFAGEDFGGSREVLLRCSFCGKPQHHVDNLVAGPSVYICDGCIDMCGDIILQESANRVIIKVKTCANSMFDDALYDAISRLVAEKYPEFDFQYETRTFDRSSFAGDKESNVAIFSMAKIYSAGYGPEQPIAEAEYNRVKKELAQSIARLSVVTQKFLNESDRNRSITNELITLKDEYLEYLRTHRAMSEPMNDLRAVLFLDIGGFSSFDHGHKAKVVDMLRGITPPLLSDRGAGEVNMWGDAIVGTFSDPSEAITSAIKFLRHLSVERLEARIGIAWGSIRISHNVATGRPDIDGQVVDFAARLEQMAPLGEILLSSDFLGLGIDQCIGELVPDKVAVKKAFGSYATGDMIDVCRLRVKMN